MLSYGWALVLARRHQTTVGPALHPLAAVSGGREKTSLAQSLDDVEYFECELPPVFLSLELPERDFQEWMDAYWAKDIQKLFRRERPFSTTNVVRNKTGRRSERRSIGRLHLVGAFLEVRTT